MNAQNFRCELMRFLYRSFRRMTLVAVCAFLIPSAPLLAQATGTNIDPPREQWVQIFEKHSQISDKTQARAERKTWSEAMRDAYDEWRLQRNQEIKGLADEFERQSKRYKTESEASRLLAEILKHYFETPNDLPARSALQERLKQNAFIRSEAQLAEFVRRYASGESLNREDFVTLNELAKRILRDEFSESPERTNARK